MLDENWIIGLGVSFSIIAVLVGCLAGNKVKF